MGETVDLHGGTRPGPDELPQAPWFRAIGRAGTCAWMGCAFALIGTGSAVARLHPLPIAVAYAAMFLVAIAAAMVDAVEMRLPNGLTYPILAGGVVVLAGGVVVLAGGVVVLAALEIAATHHGLLREFPAVPSTAGSCSAPH